MSALMINEGDIQLQSEVEEATVQLLCENDMELYMGVRSDATDSLRGSDKEFLSGELPRGAVTWRGDARPSLRALRTSVRGHSPLSLSLDEFMAQVGQRDEDISSRPRSRSFGRRQRSRSRSWVAEAEKAAQARPAALP